MRSIPDSALDIARRSAAAMYAADAASQHLGIEVDAIEPGRARARMTITATMVNGHGIAHGGYIFLLADTAFAFACNTNGEPTVARLCEIAFLRPVQEGEELVAIAEERVRAGRGGIYDVRVNRGEAETVAELRGHSTTVSPRST
jgi:acyl-CoA thioesterase